MAGSEKLRSEPKKTLHCYTITVEDTVVVVAARSSISYSVATVMGGGGLVVGGVEVSGGGLYEHTASIRKTNDANFVTIPRAKM